MMPVFLAGSVLEIVVVQLLNQGCHDGGPGIFGDKDPVPVIGGGCFHDGDATELLWKSVDQRGEVFPLSGPDHDPVQVHRIAMASITLAGANGTKETVFTENPHNLNGFGAMKKGDRSIPQKRGSVAG